MSSAPDPAKIAAFWEAVAETSPAFVEEMLTVGARGQETAEFGRVAERLQVVHPGLLLIVGGAGSGGPAEIVISAGGDTSLFGHVMAVVDAAPAAVTGRFQVRAFRPRIPDPTAARVRLKGREVGAEDIHWAATQHRDNPAVCDLRLYVPGWIDAFEADSFANRNAAESVFLLLDHLVGEWAVESQIGVIDWASTRGAAQQPTLDTLPTYLDKIAAE